MDHYVAELFQKYRALFPACYLIKRQMYVYYLYNLNSATFEKKASVLIFLVSEDFFYAL